jgi:putative ABC transport system permease protein
MRTLLDIVRQSLATLWAHKVRSFLTMFGIAWGVGSLLLLVGLGVGFRSGQTKQMANLGQDNMFVFPGRIPPVEGSYQSGQAYHFTYEEYLAIRGEAKLLRAVSPVLERDDIRAVSDYGDVEVGEGAFFGEQEDQGRAVRSDRGAALRVI